MLLLLVACLIANKYRRLAWRMVVVSCLSLWILGSQAAAYGLSRLLLKTYDPVNAVALEKAQAIVVLGGGVDLHAPEYGEAVLNNAAHARLRYGAHLKRSTHLPMMFAGGKGWSAGPMQLQSEAEVAAQTALRDLNMTIDWLDSESKDTRQSAEYAYQILAPEGKKSILLVTNDWHMQRSVRNFEAAGFTVIPAPMGYLQTPINPLFDYLPSAGGMVTTQFILKEWIGRLMT
jgi:uncharacterized SAM-binding protein YcdF (DUF218 family)